MTARVNSAEGGTNGVAVTTANSGGLSGDPWDFVFIPSGTSLTFATAAAYKASLGYRATQGTGSGSGSYVRWKLTGWPQVRFRFYFRTSAYPTSNAWVSYVSNSAGYLIASVTLTPTGVLRVADYNGTVVYTAGAPVGLNTWVRVEGFVIPGTTSTNGTISFAWAVGDAAASGTYTSTTADTGRSGALSRVYAGKLSGTWNATTDFDDFAADDTSSSFLGASGAGAVVVDPTPPPPAPVPTWPPPYPYSDAIRSGLAVWYSVSASYNGTPVQGASDLRPVGGTITDTTKPGVRRVLNLQLSPEPGLFDRLSPIGTLLSVSAHVRYTDGTVVDIPMGVFDVDQETLSEGGGGLSLTAPDKWVKIQRARFIGPGISTPGLSVTDQIAALIQDALGASEPVNIINSSRPSMPAMVWEKDRDKAIMDLAANIGAWVYFDRFGVATIADIPTIGASANWLVDSSPGGVLTSLDRERNRSKTRNVIVIESSASDGAKFPTQYVFDSDPSSPTYAGTAPMYGTGAGPFGIVVEYFDSPILTTADSAVFAGQAILARSMGLASQVSLEQVPNPAVDAFDVIDVLAPRERYDIPRVLERHVVDTVTHPLTVGPGQHIEGRSTRTDEL